MSGGGGGWHGEQPGSSRSSCSSLAWGSADVLRLCLHSCTLHAQHPIAPSEQLTCK